MPVIQAELSATEVQLFFCPSVFVTGTGARRNIKEHLPMLVTG